MFGPVYRAYLVRRWNEVCRRHAVVLLYSIVAVMYAEYYAQAVLQGGMIASPQYNMFLFLLGKTPRHLTGIVG